MLVLLLEGFEGFLAEHALELVHVGFVGGGAIVSAGVPSLMLLVVVMLLLLVMLIRPRFGP